VLTGQDHDIDAPYSRSLICHRCYAVSVINGGAKNNNYVSHYRLHRYKNRTDSMSLTTSKQRILGYVPTDKEAGFITRFSNKYKP